MTDALKKRISQLLAPDGVETRQEIESNYPDRSLPAGALVTRIAPSPTGFVHIGTIYAALICERLAHQSHGTYFLRVEDTDKKREVANGTAMILSAIKDFNLMPDEGPEIGGEYGPYLQSERQAIYLAYAIELLSQDRAYPCFATPEELEENAKNQQAAKVRPGYYGQWAIWRDKNDGEITAALDAGQPFVLRFRSLGSHDKKLKFTDAIKGSLELAENDLDIPLIKGDGSQLPTYHLAHVVDDFLMKTTLVIRGEEWLPSTPLHIELCQALQIKPFEYGHIASISVQDKTSGGKRKLSKRKDPEANVDFFHQAGYPTEAVKKYLLGLANSDFEDWLTEHKHASVDEFQLTLKKLTKSRSPLYDETKLRDYAKDVIGDMNVGNYETSIFDWLSTYGADWCKNNQLDPVIPQLIMDEDKTYLSSCFAIERSGEKIRKDIAKWSDVIEEYGYFVDAVFAKMFASRISKELETHDAATINAMGSAFYATYSVADDQTAWFEKLKTAAKSVGFAIDNQEFRANPQAFKGSLADAAKVIRVLLTGKNRTPDLWTIMKVMGETRVEARLVEKTGEADS